MKALGTIVDAMGMEIDLDLDALIGSHACVVANSGGGKSGLLRRLLETTHGRVQHIILDIEDEFYTLREHFDYVIAGGDGGDVPATVEGAAGLALAALTHGFSLIVQLNDLGEDAPEFVGCFLSALIGAPRDLWHPCLVVIDEVQHFAPTDTRNAATAGVKKLTGQGRKRGFTAVLASQRISKINADVRGDINNWMLGRVGQTLDRDIMADQLGFTRAQGRERLRMEDRTFWGFGPAIAPEPVLFRVADVETTLVKSGQAKVPTPPAPEALRAILSGLAASAQAEPEMSGARLPEDVDAIAKLRVEVADERARNAELHSVISGYQRAFQAQCTLLGDISWPSAMRADGTMPSEPLVIPPVVPAQPSSAPEPKKGAPEAHKPAPAATGSFTSGASSPSPAALAIVELLDRVNPARLTWTQAATMTKRKASGGNFNSARKWIRESGRIIEDGDFIRSAAPDPVGLSREEAILLWRSVLTNPAPRMIEALQFHPASPDVLAGMLGVKATGGNWNNGLAQLRRNGVAEFSEGKWRLADPLPGERQ